jgi:hypothetical protein
MKLSSRRSMRVALLVAPLLHKAEAAGFRVDGCPYCHSFDTSHMAARARR